MAQETNEQVASYFQEAITLRLCIESNLDDYKFGSQGGHIVYIMDANVVVFFLDPKKELDHVQLFSNQVVDNLAGTALVTAEFLFSRGLAGQNGYPALLAPSHSEDLSDVCHAILRRSANYREDIPRQLSEQARTALKAAIDRVHDPNTSPAKAAEVLLREVPEAAAILSDDLREVNELLRLFKNDLVRSLAVHPEVTGDILSVSNAHSGEVQKWTKLILLERRAHRRPGLEGRFGAGNTQKAKRDAEALVQTILLDETVQRQNRKTRYVMVTADRSLFDAYARWYWTEGVLEKKRFVLRTPLQYVPILNVLEMPTGIESSNLIQQTSVALDTLLAPLRAADPHRYPLSLSVLRLLAKLASDDENLRNTVAKIYGSNPFEFPQHESNLFFQVRKEWQQVFDASLVLNAELIRRRMHEDFSALALRLRTDVDLRDSIENFQRNAVEQLTRAHLVVNAGVSIRRLIEGVRDAGLRARGSLPVQSRFRRILAGRSLHEALDEIAEGKNYDLLASVDQALQRQMNYQTWFFAACVAYRCNRWNTALQHASVALERLASEDAATQLRERDEIVYLIAASTRYALPDAAAIKRARELLAEAISGARNRSDHFNLSRAYSQQSSLVLHVLFQIKFVSEALPAVAELQCDELLPQLKNDLIGAIEAFGKAERQHQPASEQNALVMNQVRRQVWANVVSADLLGHLARDDDTLFRPLAMDAELAKRAISELEVMFTGDQLPLILSAELIVLKYCRRLLTRSEAMKGLREIETRAAAEVLTELDKAELKQFRSVLERGAGVSAANTLSEVVRH